MERRSRGKLIAIAGTVGALLGVYLLEKAQAKPVAPPPTPTPPTVPTPPPVPPTPPPPTPTTGTLECHAYADSTEVNATVVISGYTTTLVTPFTIELPTGTYTLTATYSGQSQTVTVTIEANKLTRVDFKFTTKTVEYEFKFVPPPPPPALPWATKGYWEYGPKGQLLVPITPTMAYLRVVYGFYPEIPLEIALWYKENYPEYWHM